MRLRVLTSLTAAALAVVPTVAPAAEAALSRVEAKLQRAGFEVTGETRRKGEFWVVNATRDSIAWRLVVDGRTGAIVGQKPLGLPAAFAD